MKRVVSWVTALGLLVGFPLAVQAGPVIYSLANDWSDMANPNGVWSYNQSPGVPIPVHQADYFPGSVPPQPAWAYAPVNQFGHIPTWLKSVNNYTIGNSGLDLPIGRVMMHPNDIFNSPPGLANAVAGLTWTSPVAGTATISGDVWLGSPQLGRDIDWSIKLNGTIITGGVLHHNDPFSSSSPDSFANGSGGAAALTFSVNVGDIVNLEIVRDPHFSAGTFTGVDETISVATSSVIPEPASVALLGVGLGVLGLFGFRTFSFRFTGLRRTHREGAQRLDAGE